MKQSNRIETLQKKLKSRGLKAALITGSVNRQYLTYAGIGAGCILITEEEAVFFTDSRFIDLAGEKVRGCRICCTDEPQKEAAKLLKRMEIRDCGLEYEVVSVSLYRQLQSMLLGVALSPEQGIDDILAGMRRKKDAFEIQCFQQAQQIGDEAYLHMLEYIRPGMLESEVRMELGTYMVKLGSENYGMNFITSTGKKTAYPHGGSGDDKIREGNFVMMDFGGMIDGYSADMTRTLAVGYADEEMRQVYDTVKKAQELGLSLLKPGVTGQSVHMAVADYIAQNGYPGCFNHGLGHSLGLEIHENPRCSAYDTSILEAGEMMTVEPGIYLEGKFGVRIEDMGILVPGGFDNFTKSTKELIII